METIKDTDFLGTLLPFLIVVFIISTGVVLLNLHFQKNLYRQRLEQEALKSLHQNELLRSSIHVQEEERKRVAQDLHDELGSVLSIMRMQLLQMDGQMAASGLKGPLQLSETALASVRSISHRLMPPQLEKFGLVKTLESVTGQIDSAGKIAVLFNCPSCMPELPWVICLGLYRIVMELVSNTIRHAGASTVNLDLNCSNGCITCHYSDDGKGFSRQDAGDGWGLKSIEARVSSLNGSIDWVAREQETGTCILIQVPLLHIQ